jgi:hypothetical protein
MLVDPSARSLKLSAALERLHHKSYDTEITERDFLFTVCFITSQCIDIINCSVCWLIDLWIYDENMHK